MKVQTNTQPKEQVAGVAALQSHRPDGPGASPKSAARAPAEVRITARAASDATEPESLAARRAREEDFVKGLVHEANRAISSGSHRVAVERDKDIHKFIMKVFEKDSGELIHQYPPEDLVNTAKKLAELVGTIFDEEA